LSIVNESRYGVVIDKELKV